MRSTFAFLALSSALAAQSAWSPPQVLGYPFSTISDTGASLSADDLTMWFASSRAGGTNWELYVATRPAVGMPFGTAVLEGAVADASAVDSDPFVTRDGLELWFASNRAGSQGGSDLMVSRRASTAAPWGTPSFVVEVNSSSADASPSLTGDGLTLYFLSPRTGSPNPPNGAIWKATRPNRTTPFSTPVLVTELANSNANRGPEVSPDDLEIVWMSFDSSTSSSNMTVARRPRTSVPFGTPVVIPELSGSDRIEGPTFDSKRTTMVYPRFERSLAQGYVLHTTSLRGIAALGPADQVNGTTIHYRDPVGPNRTYFGAVSLGRGPIPFFGRDIPLDLDWLFQVSVGGLTGFTTGYGGALDQNGEATANFRNAIPALVGLDLWTGFFTLDISAPFSILTISNSIQLGLQ
jgi:hypothetical protein